MTELWSSSLFVAVFVVVFIPVVLLILKWASFCWNKLGL